MPSVVTFEDVKKTYGDFQALKGLTYSIHEGEIYGLIGPNGAGKTTSIRILTGLQRATGGKVQVFGKSTSDPRVRPLIGYMPQDTALYNDLTIQENLELFGRLYGLRKKEITSRITDLLEFVNLTDWAHTLITNLSGGMRHRASLAAALLPKPKLLVLDEPTVGVDPELRAGFWQRFATMQQDKTTILITTHYMDEAMRCDRVGLVNQGTLIAEGTPQQLIKEAHVTTLEEAFLHLARKGES